MNSGVAACCNCSWFLSCSWYGRLDATVPSVLDRYASASVHVFVADSGRAEGAKAKGEGEGKARAAMGGADRLDAVRLAVADKFWY